MSDLHIVIIDPQNDFMGEVDGSPYTVKTERNRFFQAKLPVKGAVDDMRRMAELIHRLRADITDIHVTLDSHLEFDIGHPVFWVDANGKPPTPFTIINKSDIQQDIWLPREDYLYDRVLAYADKLEKNSQYRITVWPEHCVVGSWGHQVQPSLAKAIEIWENTHWRIANYIYKGRNCLTEHYGALQAEVPDPNDPMTQLNRAFLAKIEEAELIALCGEASSHCVLETVKQIADNVDEKHLKKIHILTDCMSPVAAIPDGPNFPEIAQQFFAKMAERGMNLTTSTQFLA